MSEWERVREREEEKKSGKEKEGHWRTRREEGRYMEKETVSISESE